MKINARVVSVVIALLGAAACGLEPDSGPELQRAVQALEPDTTPPTASITAPLAGATLSGFVSITATADDDVGVTFVELYLDDLWSGSPYPGSSVGWDTRYTADGVHTLRVRAHDEAGNTGDSELVSVTVDNFHSPPVVDLWV